MKFKISELASAIKNAQNAKKSSIIVPSNFSTSLMLTQFLKAELIVGFSYTNKYFSQFEVQLKYFNGVPVIKDIVVFSRPSQRLYVNVETLRTKFLPSSFVLLSTSKSYDVEYLHVGYGNTRKFLKRSAGVLTLQEALRLNVGGELLLQVIV